MGDAKHTPGPWEYDPESESVGHGGAVIARVMTPEGFPYLDPDEHDIEAICAECQANGYTMAAAPDLLEAAGRVIEAFGEDKVILDRMTGEQHAKFTAMLALDAAIKKAKGVGWRPLRPPGDPNTMSRAKPPQSRPGPRGLAPHIPTTG